MEEDERLFDPRDHCDDVSRHQYTREWVIEQVAWWAARWRKQHELLLVLQLFLPNPSLKITSWIDVPQLSSCCTMSWGSQFKIHPKWVFDASHDILQNASPWHGREGERHRSPRSVPFASPSLLRSLFPLLLHSLPCTTPRCSFVRQFFTIFKRGTIKTHTLWKMWRIIKADKGPCCSAAPRKVKLSDNEQDIHSLGWFDCWSTETTTRQNIPNWFDLLDSALHSPPRYTISDIGSKLFVLQSATYGAPQIACVSLADCACNYLSHQHCLGHGT